MARITVKELLDNNINVEEIDVISIYINGVLTSQHDNPETLYSALAWVVKDYEVEYDSDEPAVYLHIYV